MTCWLVSPRMTRGRLRISAGILGMTRIQGGRRRCTKPRGRSGGRWRDSLSRRSWRRYRKSPSTLLRTPSGARRWRRGCSREDAMPDLDSEPEWGAKRYERWMEQVLEQRQIQGEIAAIRIMQQDQV